MIWAEYRLCRIDKVSRCRSDTLQVSELWNYWGHIAASLIYLGLEQLLLLSFRMLKF